jgi:X-Pro dipeptidyl-peptidase
MAKMIFSLSVVGRGAAAAVASAAFLTLVSAQAPPAKPIFESGQALVVPAFEDQGQWIRHRLWVETEFDSDGDRKRDRVHVDVTRQKQTDTEGLKVPVVYESSPYFAGTSGDRKFLWNVNQEVGEDPPVRQSQPEIDFVPGRTSIVDPGRDGLAGQWVPRGFAVVRSEAPGTGLSEGCATVGGDPERLAPKAVIDWLNGRAKGFTTATGAEEVKATWSTGKVGMMGTSYNGTIPVAAATTGVAGLEAIIPIAPNTSYYHYYRSHGLVRHPGGWLGEDIDFLYDFVNSGDTARRATCNKLYRDGAFTEGRDRRSGDYNAFWIERDLLPDVGNIKAAVLMAHAFNDWNVVPEHSVRISNALKGKVPLQQYFHQGGHGGAPPMELMNKWFTRFLYGVQNGVEKDPKAWIVREVAPAPPAAPASATGAPPTTAPARGRGRGNTPPPTPYADYPNPAASVVALHLTAGGLTQGGLVLTTPTTKGITEKLTDNVEFSAPALALAANSPHRLIYATPELTEAVHISGTPQVTLRLASSKPAANLSVYLVQLPWFEGPIGTSNLITRGWADPQNHKSLTGGGDFHSRERGAPLKPGEFVTLTFDLQPDDQIIPAGKRIGLMILSSDRDFTLWPKPGTELTIDLDAARLRLPVVGGPAAFTKATVR